MSTLATLRTEARLVIPEIADTNALSDARFLILLNRAAQQFLHRTEGYPKSTTFNTVADQAEYPLTSAISDYLKIQKSGIWYYNGTRWTELDPYTMPRLDDDFPTWRNASSGTPMRYAIDSGSIFLNPPPSSNGTDNVKAYHFSKGTDMTADANNIFTGFATELSYLVPYEEIVFDHLRYQVFTMLGQKADAAQYLQQFYLRCQEAKQELLGRLDLEKGDNLSSLGFGMVGEN